MNDLIKNRSDLKPDKVEELSSEEESIELKISDLENEKKAKEKSYKEKILEQENIKKLIIKQSGEIGIKIKD
jgi:hypothetical protein